jgi:hypothetical protein
LPIIYCQFNPYDTAFDHQLFDGRWTIDRWELCVAVAGRAAFALDGAMNQCLAAIVSSRHFPFRLLFAYHLPAIKKWRALKDCISVPSSVTMNMNTQ